MKDLAVNVSSANATDLNEMFFELNKVAEGQSTEWYRTNSGRSAQMIVEAEDEEEIVGVLQFVGGQNELRRRRSFRPCLFGPVSGQEEWESDGEDFVGLKNKEIGGVDSSSSESEDEGDDTVGDLPNLDILLKRGRRSSVLRINKTGDVFEEDAREDVKTHRQTESLTMDAFGNIILASQEQQNDSYLEHLKMKRKMQQKRRPDTPIPKQMNARMRTLRRLGTKISTFFGQK